jgi:hypothetical protein
VETFTFRDEKFMSAAEKQLVLQAWITFLKHGCQREHFTERLYQHITLHCSFIAHYDRRGFYDVYFARPNSETIRFLDQFDPNKSGHSAEMGDTFWLAPHVSAVDLNEAMRAAAGPYIPRLRLQAEEAERQSDLTVAAAILAKYGKRIADSDTVPHAAFDQRTDSSVRNSDPPPEQLNIFNTTG